MGTKPNSRSSYRAGIGFVVVVLAVMGVLAVADAVEDRIRLSQILQAKDTSASVLTNVEGRLASMVGSVRAVRAFFDGSETVTRDEFRQFSRTFLQDAKVSALEWVPRVKHEDRPALEAAAVADGLEGFRFTEVGEEGGLRSMVTASDRDAYYPVYFVEPLQPNLAALGFDLGSSPDRLDALSRATDSGEVVASQPIRLVQDPSTNAILLFLPIFKNGETPPTVAARREQLLGLALGVFSLQPLGEFGAIHGTRTHVSIHDADARDSVLYRSEDDLGVPLTSIIRETVQFAGRELVVTVAGPTDETKRTAYWAVVGIGLLCVVSFAAYLDAFAERNRQNRDLRAAHTVLRKKNAEIARFYHTASHELKTPLTSAREFTALLTDGVVGPLNENQYEYLGYVRESCDQLTRYINDMLDMSRLETGKLRVIPEPIGLTDLIRSTVTMAQPEYKRRNIELTHCIEPDVPMAMVDGSRFTQVIANLLANARKFTSDDGAVELSVRLASDEDMIEIAVRDSGIGIAPDMLDEVFERLSQVNQGNYRDESEWSGGLGLGLALCREIVTLHGGRIWVESTLGVGSIFRFTVPTAPFDEQPTPLMTDAAIRSI